MNIYTPSETSPSRGLPGTLILLLISMAAIQMVRALFYWSLGTLGTTTRWFEPAGDLTNALSMLITGVILWLEFRPSLRATGFLPFPRAKSRFVYLGIVLLFVILAITGIQGDTSRIYPTIVSCLIFPLFEEPLFRGWMWNRLGPALPERGRGLLSVVITTALFSLWHLGYWDVVALHVRAGATFSTVAHIMLMKMALTAVIGLIAGSLRWKTGNIYASILFHAYWNLFGR